MATQQLSVIRTYLENLVNLTNSGDSYIGSTLELQELNEGYQQTAYRYNWPQTMKRYADVTVANLDRYSLQTDFRKFNYIYSWADKKELTDIDQIPFSQHRYAVDLNTSEYILSEIPVQSSTAYTFSASYSAGTSVVITLNSVSGISVQDEVFISDGASSEFTSVQAVDTTNTTITVKLANSHNNKTLYRTGELNYFQYQKKIILLANSSDVTILPDETDFIIPHYAAYLFYFRNEQYDRADKQFQIWDTRIQEAWLAWSKIASGESNQFSVDNN